MHRKNRMDTYNGNDEKYNGLYVKVLSGFLLF